MPETVLDKFLRYVSIDTTSNPESSTQPSTKNQLAFSGLLVEELKVMGIESAGSDEYGYVMATIPSNLPKGETAQKIGFIAHIDTSPDVPGAGIKPQIHRNYGGGEIVINKKHNTILSPVEFPELEMYKGQTIITTDGSTLLGADDKAGVAEIMTAAEYIMTHPEFLHGEIRIGFTPDEEISKGVDRFDIKKFDVQYAYTLDGGEIGEIEYENFNAAFANLFIQGKNLHSGYAKGKMLNAITLGAEFNSMLPVGERPEYTADYEGFFHIIRFSGTVEKTALQYIIRDHDSRKFEQKKRLMEAAVEFLNEKYGQEVFKIELEDQYYNMRAKVEPHYHIVQKAIDAMEMAGIEPKIRPIRGGTDGARLSFLGLPCPNIFAGGHNFHSRYEYLPVESMEAAVKVILNIITLYRS